ncbi:hypothetical protein XarjCFBP7653_14665 [Xanthomonas arboricola]|nr:hypothetical protein XarjCFBP7653_14665 [Xanthomonas arboricola]
MHTDHLDWPLPARRRGTLSGMDAAPEPTRTYLRRVLRWWAGKGPAAHLQRRGRGALTACRTRRKPVPRGSVAASMPPHGPAIGEDTAPDSVLIVLLKAMHTDHLDGSLPPIVAGPSSPLISRYAPADVRVACAVTMLAVDRAAF